MDLQLTEDEEAVRDLFVAFFEKECSTTLVRGAEQLGFSAYLWSRLAETGAPLLGASEEVGGAGASLLDLALVCEQVGHHVAPVPLVDHFVATRAVERAGALAALSTCLRDNDIMSTVVRNESGSVAPAGAVARYLVGMDRSGQFTLVQREPPGVSTPNLASLPLTKCSAETDAPNEMREVLAVSDEANAIHAYARAEWQALMAASLVGLADASLEMVRAYVCERRQFGVPIGSFQAIQHGLADLVGPIEGARLLALKAAWTLQQPNGAGEVLAAMAFLFASEVAQQVTERAVHYSGGYGLIDENDLQLYFRRAKGWTLLGGDPRLEYADVGRRLCLQHRRHTP